MKNKSFLYRPSIIAIMSLLLFSACKKTPITVSRLTQITETLGGQLAGKVMTTNIQYNTDVTVMAFNGSGFAGQNKLFAYNGSTILVRTYDLPNTYHGLDSLTLNSIGRLINLRSFASYKTDWINRAYMLNASKIRFKVFDKPQAEEKILPEEDISARTVI